MRERQAARDRVAARRAGQPRRLKVIEPAAMRMLGLAADIRMQGGGRSATLSADTVRALAAFKAPVTWNRYLPTLRRWEEYAERRDVPFLPADPGHFANFLSEAAQSDKGSTQTKQRSCAIAALSAVAGVPSPTEDDLVDVVRAGIRRGRRGGRRGSARPIYPHEIPAAPGSPPPLEGRSKEAHLPPSVRRRARAQATRHMAVLSGGALRFDDVHEAQLGDVCWFEGVADLSLFGTKTDTMLVGQAGAIPASADPASGYQALLEGTRLGLQRLRELPEPVLRAVAASFSGGLSAQERGGGPREFAAWPADLQALAAPLYAAGLPVHCLPLCGTWQYERLTPDSDLAVPMPADEFVARSRTVLAEAGVAVERFGAHSFRRGSAGALFHSGLGSGTVATALRHRSERSTAAYVSDAARMAALADTIAPPSQIGAGPRLRGRGAGPGQLRARCSRRSTAVCSRPS